MNPEKNRRWFVALAVATLIGFAIFVAGITLAAIAIPQIHRSGGTGALPGSRTVGLGGE